MVVVRAPKEKDIPGELSKIYISYAEKAESEIRT